MEKRTSTEAIESSEACYSTLEQWARGKIQAQLQQLLEEEVTTFLGRARHERRGTVSPIDPPTGSRNGYGKPRTFSMMSGTVTVRRPRVRDLTERFASKVLPLFKRRTQEVGTLLPELYLHGLSTGDFELALRGLLGKGAPLSASSLQRLKARFELEYETWKKQDLSDLEVVYWWADGLYVKAGIEDRKSALLTIVGALTTGEKIVLACESGERESKESWLKLLRDLKHRGLTFPRLTVADGHLGIWAACGEIHPTSEEQRCWNHKITNVLDALPKRVQLKAAEWLKAMPYAKTKAECERRRDECVRTYRRTEGKAVDTLLRDWDRMVTFYAFPREHWRHLRTTNIVESPFASVRLRTDASRCYKRVEGAKAIIWKMLRVAERSWRKLNAPELLPLVASGMPFKDGIRLKSEHKRNDMDHQPERTAA
ncbi:MAG TPA: IS256 family transposase [Nitrospira sp.]|nr:IS256 family transposase [Nitrospira sp.]